MALLDELNPQQREAVLATAGPVLVLAGAGSGKTRVITYRIAHLIHQQVSAENILAVTFTNKAAEQMKQRVEALLGVWRQGEPWISTFHSFCARLLRSEAPRLGFSRGFTIYDEDDQTAAVKLAMRQLGGDERAFTPRGLLERISYAKNHGLSPELLAAQAVHERDLFVAKLFPLYEAVLRKAGALDFDDLLLRAVEVLERFPDACAAWQQRFAHILVDEFQDTNRCQYVLLRLLGGERPNLCVVGDEDQSIYGWRGAVVDNILHFAEDFPGTTVVRLEENYRSTQVILDAAAGVVAHNARRLGKDLRAVRERGAPLRYFEAQDAGGEAGYVAQEIARLLRLRPEAHIAVLYRTNFQSRSFEEALRRGNIGYRVVGGFSFYERAEIKDALAYVRLVLNPEDDVAFLRVVNTPARGIGKIALEALRARAQERGLSLWAAIGEAPEGAPGRKPLRQFRELIESLQPEWEKLPPAAFLLQMLDATGYLDMAVMQDDAEGTSRAENLRELVNAVAELTERGEPFSDFLDRAALVSDVDSYDERAAVSLMTLHSAKGLEFDHVFLVGMDEGLFPHSRSVGEGELEEERRLCYVGMTRAKDTLTLTRALYRRGWGSERLAASLPSRFLREIPGELIQTAEGSLADAGEARRYDFDPEFADLGRSGWPRRSAAQRQSAASRTSRTNPLVGLRVRHPKYGVGTIIGVEGEDDDRRLTISFPDYGTKKVVERYAQLEPV